MGGPSTKPSYPRSRTTDGIRPSAGPSKKPYVDDGTYFSEPLFEGLGDHNTEEINQGGIGTEQGYITSLAARAIIFIEADNSAIGLMAFIVVGMDEVSTCDITVKEGQHVKKGEETGMFHFGGSSHCLIFRKGVVLEGFPQPGEKENVPVRGKLAVVKS
jgi:phosphatidylserine decarboxylase